MSSDRKVRVRFAPSPTGFLHVGGARTAVFNWLFAKNRKGKFLLRIEDTDPERSKSELSGQIIRSLNWLGMIPDEPVVYQSDRISSYRVAIQKLVEEKKAYYAFETTSELRARREQAQANKTNSQYDRAALKLDENTVKKYLAEGREYVIRFFIPEGVTGFDDIVHGRTSFDNNEMDDFVLLRSDGSPVYQIAVVVDDHDMGITHVIRGDDHLSNTPKQILLYKALGWEVPQFAHLPMILDEEKKKLSKRRNTVAVEKYWELGYLPEALFNFLTLLGFAPENNKEILSREELVNMFTFDRVNKKSAVFDMKKLNWINAEYIKSSDERLIAELLKEQLERQNILPAEKVKALSVQYIIRVIGLLKERVSTIDSFIERGKYFFVEPDTFDEKGIKKYWNKETQNLLKEYVQSISSADFTFNSRELEEHLRKFAEEKNTKAAQLIHPIRLALTGFTVSPGIFDVMEVLGKEKVISRITYFTTQNLP